MTEVTWNIKEASNNDAASCVFTLVGSAGAPLHAEGCTIMGREFSALADAFGIVTVKLFSTESIQPKGTSYVVSILDVNGQVLKSARYSIGKDAAFTPLS
jgi:hypothetical protein